MSHTGECHDNAVAESFIRTLKTKLIDDKDYQLKEDARQSIFEYFITDKDCIFFWDT